MEIRPMIKYVKDNLKGCLVGCEVGVWQGDNAVSIMNNLNIEKCYFVDPYKRFVTASKRVFGKKRMLMNLIYTVVRLEPFGTKKTQIVFKTSKKGCKDVPDNLDFVYLDANKKTKFVREDIKIWYEKVRKGGVFGGHDYCKEVDPQAFDEINNFIKNTGLKLYTKEIDWWVVKK